MGFNISAWRVEEGERYEAGIEEEGKVEKKKSKVGELEDISNSLMREWQVNLMREGSKCMILVASAISPRYQMHYSIAAFNSYTVDLNNTLNDI